MFRLLQFSCQLMYHMVMAEKISPEKESKQSELLGLWLLGAILGMIFLAIFLVGHSILPSPESTSAKTLPPVAAPTKPQPVTKDIPTNITPKTVSAQTVPPSPSGVSGIPILMYHYVGNNPNPTDHQRDILSITPDKLDQQLAWLAQNGYTPITLDTLYGLFAKKETIKKPIVLTFDDGYIDFYVNAFQILRKYNFRAVSFIPTGLMGTSYYMSWDQIKEIKNSGLVSFQAHTVNHLSLPTLSYSDKLYQLVTSKKTLEQQLGTTINFIAYPYGASDPDTWRAALAAGFVGGAGTWYGKATGPGINMPRIRITGTISLGDFIQKVTN